jgi:hypothetical protein
MRTRQRIMTMGLCLAFTLTLPALRQAVSAPNPPGIAARYSGDEGIERDPRVLFVEDFETGGIREIGARWGEVSKPENMTMADDIHANSPGKRSLHIAGNGHLYTHTRGVDTMHVRFYVKFHPRTGYIHHFVHLYADRTPTAWAKGNAGKKPPGDESFTSGIEPWGKWGEIPPPGIWHFYSYWQEMKPDGRGNYWGNHFEAPQEPIQAGRWYCVEAMVKANSAPQTADGEQAFWIDGRLVGSFQGIRWRSSDKLKLNTLWLLYYVTENSARQNRDTDPNRVYEVWFDDIVVATEYIGPVQGRPKNGKKAATPSRSALQTPGLLLAPPGQVVFTEKFEDGKGLFQDGSIIEDAGVNGTKALAIPPKGASIWRAYSVPVQDSTTLRFKLKPLADVNEAIVLIWSDGLKDNARYHIRGLRKDRWTDVDFRAIEARAGWGMDGPSLDGQVLNNFKIFYDGPEDARLLLDDFEICK